MDEKDKNVTPSNTVCYGIISVTGRRRSMEDNVTVAPSLVHVTLGNNEQPSSFDLFAVYDGHGGSHVSHRCKLKLHHLIAEEITAEAARKSGVHGGQMDWEKVMITGFARMEQDVSGEEFAAELQAADDVGSTVGSTALVVVAGKEELVVANCGNCRAVLGRGPTPLPLSHDHKLDHPDEKARVEAAGGHVAISWENSYTSGVPNTARSIGDHQLKQYITFEPEVTVHQREIPDNFLIIGSNGLWDSMPNELACDIVNQCFNRRVEVGPDWTSTAAASLVELAIARGSKDNISVVVVEL